MALAILAMRRVGVLALTVVDAAGQVWRRVPGHGPVLWSVDQISEHASYLLDAHRPGTRWRRLRRIRHGARPLRLAGSTPLWRVWPTRHCKLCLAAWPCREVRWARWWLASRKAALDGTRRDHRR